MLSCFQNSLFVCFWRDIPQWATTSSFTKFLHHTQRRTTVGRTPLDKRSARRRDLYPTTHNLHNRQTSIPRWDFFFLFFFMLNMYFIQIHTIHASWSLTYSVVSFNTQSLHNKQSNGGKENRITSPYTFGDCPFYTLFSTFNATPP